jgi:hypothetical protein
MNSNIYIPGKVNVGFQERTDTSNGKLAYITYIDDKGKLRKEKSWTDWQDKKIPIVEVDNKPSKFSVFKDKHRYGYWNSSRELVRMLDEVNKFDFEISVGNLITILGYSKVDFKDIDQECVYAWEGTSLILLPTNSQEYQDALKFTSKQKTGLKGSELVVGRTYISKRDNIERVYLGKHDFYTFDGNRQENSFKSTKKKTKQFLFGYDYNKNASKKVEEKSSVEFISYEKSTDISPDLNEYLEIFNTSNNSAPIVGMVKKENFKKPVYNYPPTGFLNDYRRGSCRLIKITSETEDEIKFTSIKIPVCSSHRVDADRGVFPEYVNSRKYTTPMNDISNAVYMTSCCQDTTETRLVFNKKKGEFSFENVSRTIVHHSNRYLGSSYFNGKLEKEIDLYKFINKCSSGNVVDLEKLEEMFLENGYEYTDSYSLLLGNGKTASSSFLSNSYYF